MAPVKSGTYEYCPESIIEVRKKLGYNQSQMASHLGVPVNTLYRWETGATTPDAESLAAIHSIALEQGITPNFFKKRRKHMVEKKRDRLIVMWDFQNLGLSSNQVKPFNDCLQDDLKKRFPSINKRLLKAFAHPNQSAATDVLNESGWRVWEDSDDMDEEIIDQSQSDCGQNPQAMVLVLITKDGDFRETIEELKLKGVRIYVLGPTDTSKELIESVGNKRFIPWPSNIYPETWYHPLQFR